MSITPDQARGFLGRPGQVQGVAASRTFGGQLQSETGMKPTSGYPSQAKSAQMEMGGARDVARVAMPAQDFAKPMPSGFASPKVAQADNTALIQKINSDPTLPDYERRQLLNQIANPGGPRGDISHGPAGDNTSSSRMASISHVSEETQMKPTSKMVAEDTQHSDVATPPPAAAPIPITPEPEKGLSMGAKIGIGFGVSIFVILVIIILWSLFGKQAPNAPPPPPPPSV